MKKWPVVVCLCFMQFTIAVCQQKVMEELETDNEWSEGSILLANGTELKGLVQFNDRIGVINFQDGKESKAMTPRGVTAFEFFDGIENKQRLFYSMEYKPSEKEAKRPWFFELLQDFGPFAIVSKIDPVVANEAAYIDRNQNITYKGVISQTETVYFLTEDGMIEPYLQVRRKIVDREKLFGSDFRDRESNSVKILDKKLIFKFFTEDEVKQMERFAIDNNLDKELKDDFVKMLEFGSTLKKN